MNILVIGYVWPESRSSAAGRRSLELLKLFRQQGWRVTFASPAEETAHSNDLVSLGIHKAAIQLNHASFDDFIAQLAPDLVIFDRFLMEEQFGWRVAKVCPSALRMVDTIDLHFLRLARQEAHKAGRKLSEAELLNDTAKRELASIWRSDMSLIISAAEMEILTSRLGVPPDLVHYLPLITDFRSDHQHTWLSFEQREHFVVIGNLRHAPNWDALLFLKQVLWPGIRKALAKAELHVYGAYTDAKARALHQPREGFMIRGRADDAKAEITKARIMLAPLRFGAGLKGKLLEAMETGTPSITTSVGAEGMQGALPWAGVIADQPERYIDAAVKLYQDRHYWQRCQQQGVMILTQLFNARPHQERFLERLDDVSSQLNHYREKNVVGAILRHHHHRSTEYMSRWIEVKQALNDCVEASSANTKLN